MNYRFLASSLIILATALCGQTRPGEIDGKKNPELITDFDAYRGFFMSYSDMTNGMSRAARENELTTSGFSRDQVNLILVAANEFRVALEQGNRKMQKIKDSYPKGSTVPENILLQYDQVWDSVAAKQTEIQKTLEANLGADGTKRFHDFLRAKVIPYMTVFRGGRR